MTDNTEAQWKAISIYINNDPLTSANIHYNSSGQIERPQFFTVTFYPAEKCLLSASYVSGDGDQPVSRTVTNGQPYGELPDFHPPAGNYGEGPADISVNLYIVFYDSRGKMVGLDMQKINIDDLQSAVLDRLIEFPADEEVNEIKIIILDDNLSPLIGAASLL